MSSYDALAASYDGLMADGVYRRRADYLEKLFRKSRIPVHTVLDLACGTGTIACLLAAKGYAVTATDLSEEMLTQAMSKAADLEQPPLFVQQSLPRLRLPEPVDAVFSNAVFHWIDDQDALLERIALALRPNGQLVCEFGGRGCVESVHASLEKSFAVRGLCYPRTFYFPTIGEYAPRLDAHGLLETMAALLESPTELQWAHGMEDGGERI